MIRKDLDALRARRTWVFDLDNTLYPASCDLFAQIDVRMTTFVSDYLDMDRTAARALQKQYYRDHGTTLAGMMRHHQMDPAGFLAFVHDLDHSPLPVDGRLRAALTGLPGRKYVLTNGSKGHAEGVTRAMQIHDLFDGMFGIEEMNYTPKPHQDAFDGFVSAHDVDPHDAVFFEDLPRNLAPAHAMGFATVLVHSDKDWSHEPEGARPAGPETSQGPHIDHATDDLTAFLETVLAA